MPVFTNNLPCFLDFFPQIDNVRLYVSGDLHVTKTFDGAGGKIKAIPF